MISCPKSPYLRKPLKTRRDLRESSGCIPEEDFTVASYHLNIIKQEIGQRSLFLYRVQDNHLTHYSIMEDCFYGETSNLHRYTSKGDCLTPVKPLSFSMHSKRNAVFLSSLTEQRNSNWHRGPLKHIFVVSYY